MYICGKNLPIPYIMVVMGRRHILIQGRLSWLRAFLSDHRSTNSVLSIRVTVARTRSANTYLDASSSSDDTTMTLRSFWTMDSNGARLDLMRLGPHRHPTYGKSPGIFDKCSRSHVPLSLFLAVRHFAPARVGFESSSFQRRGEAP